MEKKIGHDVHWDICLLHFNELPLRELFNRLDGVTLGPRQFSGPIGKMLVGCKLRPIKSFTPIFSDDLPILQEEVFKELSTDQQYLYKICHAIQSGKVDTSLANMKPGPMVFSRFVTTACRVLRYYVSNDRPSRNLITLASFIIQVYGPMWFSIKSEDSIAMGPKHLFKYIQLIREHTEKTIQDIVFPVIERNSYFAHPENVLLAMLVDENGTIRKQAVTTILKTRALPDENNNTNRIFNKPKLNFKAKTYYEMCSIDNFEPPMTKNLSDEDLSLFIDNNEIIANRSKRLPCHTQCVERFIQLVSNASSRVFGEKRRNQKIQATIESRAVLPVARTKKDYASYMNK